MNGVITEQEEVVKNILSAQVLEDSCQHRTKMTELNYYLICLRCGKIKEIGGS